MTENWTPHERRLHNSLNLARFKVKNYAAHLKCYSVLCAFDNTHGAVVPE